jgi:hypothetical protein
MDIYQSETPSPDIPCGPNTEPTGRDERGRFLPGNLAAVRHALRTERLPKEFAHLAAEVDEYVSASIADDGGDSEVPTRRRSLHEYRARIHRRVLQLDAAIEIRGLFDRRGKLRVAWLQQLQGLITTAKGIDTLLGLERRQKPARTLEQVLTEAEEQHAREERQRSPRSTAEPQERPAPRGLEDILSEHED